MSPRIARRRPRLTIATKTSSEPTSSVSSRYSDGWITRSFNPISTVEIGAMAKEMGYGEFVAGPYAKYMLS